MIFSSHHPKPYLRSTSHRRRGFSLIEVMVAVGILSALAGIGWGTMVEHLPRFRLVRIAKQFRAELLSMRQIAVQTNREAKFELLAHSGGDCSDTEMWGGAWEKSVGDQIMGSRIWDLLPEDSAEDGTDDDQSYSRISFFDGGNENGRDVCFRDWGTLSGPSWGRNQDSIVFSPRGWLRNPASDFNTRGYLEFHFVNQDAHRKGVFDAVKVQVSRAGMIRLLRVPQPHNLNQVGTSVTSTVQ